MRRQNVCDDDGVSKPGQILMLKNKNPLNNYCEHILGTTIT